ncbi:hypothetical protein DFP73DRAFT_632585 [Morchella snyderi]|nr:hypothetical protein DFP73DRAFT_632585 [Morchella snyderi]
MSEATPSTTDGIIEILRLVMAATSKCSSPAELDRMTPEESTRVVSIIKATVDTAWQCAHREALDAVERNEQSKRRMEGIHVLVGVEQNQDQARTLEMIKTGTENAVAETERLRVETLKIEAERGREVAQKEKLVLEVERVNAEIVFQRLRIEPLNRG